jgi:hypothetical protein
VTTGCLARRAGIVSSWLKFVAVERSLPALSPKCSAL